MHRQILSKFPKEEKYGLTDQIRRATDSILLNIAEGSYRNSDKDFAHFLNQSASSLYEVVSCLDLAFDSGYINNGEYQEFIGKSEGLVKQPSAFTKTLKELK